MAENLSIRLYDGYLKFYMKIQNPQLMSDDDWAEAIQDLHYIRTNEEKNSQIPT